MRPGALLGEAVGRPDGVVDVDVGQRSRSRQQRCLPAQVDRQPGRDRVELTDMTKGERAQARPSGKGARTPSDSRGIPPWRSSAMSSMQSARRPPPRPSWDLRVRVDPARSVDPRVLGHELPRTGSFRELQDRRRTRARHQGRIIEDGCEAVADSHPADAFPCAEPVTSASHSFVAQQGIRAPRPAGHRPIAVDLGLAAHDRLEWSVGVVCCGGVTPRRC